MNEQIKFGRAKNAVLNYFERTLSVPKIYLDTDWAGQKVDVLAINRDGAGDVYATLFFSIKNHGRGPGYATIRAWEEFENVVSRLKPINAHFKYAVAVQDIDSEIDFRLRDEQREKLYAEDGLGRIGALRITFAEDRDPTVEAILKPERFRAKVIEIADNYMREHTADWEIRA
jgi:hypothetical protein